MVVIAIAKSGSTDLEQSRVRHAGATATAYFARPGDGLVKRILIRLDNVALAIYAWMKSRLGISDAFVSRVLDLLGRGKS